MPNVFLSIVIPALNEERYISHCLKAINSLNAIDYSIEIIVVDNGSTDYTIALSRKHGAKVLINREGTIATLRNIGANAAKGRFLAFLDADCVVPNDWLEKTLFHLEKSNQVILGFRFSIPQDSNWVARSWDMLFAKRYKTAEVDWVPSGNMVMPQDVFVSVGGFDENLETNEDYDFCHRARIKGYKIISSSETAVTHLRPPRTLIEVFKKELWHGSETFNSFISDVRQNKGFNLLKRKNFKVVAYAFFWLICILIVLPICALSFYNGAFWRSIIILICIFSVPFFLAIKNTFFLRKYTMTPGLAVLFTVYGVARAIGLIIYGYKVK